MPLSQFQTTIELAGADYPARVQFERDGHRPLISTVEISRTIYCYYDESGNYRPHVKEVALEINGLLDDRQLGALMDEIVENDLVVTAELQAEAEQERRNERLIDHWNYWEAA